MPTARELLEQADALMRRNRIRTADTRPGPVDIPMLTEVVDARAQPPDDIATARSQPEPSGGADVAPPDTGRVESQMPVLALDDVPVLTDVVEEIEAPTIAEAFDVQGEPSQWLDNADRGEISITGPLPDSIAVVPPAITPAPIERAAFAADEMPAEIEITAPDDRVIEEAAATSEISAPDDEVIEEPPAQEISAPDDRLVEEATANEISTPDGRLVEATAASEISAPDDRVIEEETAASEIDELALDELEAPVAPPAEPPSAIAAVASARSLVSHHEPIAAAAIPADEDERWDALAEEVRMQVLQRIDIFTDTGLREQLTARLQPIVDRASADLVATINQHVGQLLRTYVAEAIEREIEKWRQGGG